ncbi:hypothetical protein L1987_59721 [Smallanthus sonchifolius]|uniref:Uncharacterized protein n=1 Tax=Smallanthus sonchifolius TaxID=185202 RepID=A0ACB9D642_9ASTR|nr:hypothetical protein L1987_59721 [Smallanthus sonchifolius]
MVSAVGLPTVRPKAVVLVTVVVAAAMEVEMGDRDDRLLAVGVPEASVARSSLENAMDYPDLTKSDRAVDGIFEFGQQGLSLITTETLKRFDVQNHRHLRVISLQRIDQSRYTQVNLIDGNHGCSLQEITTEAVTFCNFSLPPFDFKPTKPTHRTILV